MKPPRRPESTDGSGEACGPTGTGRGVPPRAASSPAARRASRRCRLVSPATTVAPLPRLAVSRVRAAPAAVLPELHAIGRVPLRLLGLIVASLALRAGERDRDSDSGGHVVSSGRGVRKGGGTGSGGRTRTYDTRIMIPLL